MERRDAIGSTQTVTAKSSVERAQATRTRRERQEQTGRADLLAPIAPVPREVIVPVEPARRAELESWLSGLRGAVVTIRVASRGEKKALMNRANENAGQALQRSKMSRISDMGTRTAAAERRREGTRARSGTAAHRMLRHFEHRGRGVPGRLDGRVRGRHRQEIRIPQIRHSR